MAIELAGAPLLADLVSQYGVRAVWEAVWQVHQFPPQLITTVPEAMVVSTFLFEKERK